MLKKSNLTIHNYRFITYADRVLIIDVLGGVDTHQIERMICTLRITYENYPPIRTTLDLYSDPQADRLIRTICDKWQLKFADVSGSVHSMIAQLEGYKLDRLKYPMKIEGSFEMNEGERKEAKKYLKDQNLVSNLHKDLKQIGILEEKNHALILFLAMASHKFSHPFSVLCLAQNGIGKNYLLRKLSACMPQEEVSFHTQISNNALYYFDNQQIDGKVLFIEDLQWTHELLSPLSTLQMQGQLIKTRATKDKEGMLHSTSFELSGKLCLLACTYGERKSDQLQLPFLCLNLEDKDDQDLKIMDYQKKLRAGLIDQSQVANVQRKLRCVLASLDNVKVINPYAPYIELPEDIPEPRKQLYLLLNFIDVITFSFQHQRNREVDKTTGEVSILTELQDIELAFSLLKQSLFQRVDELSIAARNFYNWLQTFQTEQKRDGFTAFDIRKVKRIHPRTLNRYLKELTDFHYLKVIGGNKHRGGFIYQLADVSELNSLEYSMQDSLAQTLRKMRRDSVGQLDSSHCPTLKASGGKGLEVGRQ